MLPLTSVNNVIFVVCVASTLTYFFFTVTARINPTDPGIVQGLKRVLMATSEVGKWAMMIGFGASFGTTVMARISLFIGRLQFLFGEWIHILK